MKDLESMLNGGEASEGAKGINSLLPSEDVEIIENPHTPAESENSLLGFDALFSESNSTDKEESEPEDDQSDEDLEEDIEAEGGGEEEEENEIEEDQTEEGDSIELSDDDVLGVDKNGDEVTFAEYKEGFLRQEDYDKQVEEVVAERVELEKLRTEADNAIKLGITDTMLKLAEFKGKQVKDMSQQEHSRFIELSTKHTEQTELLKSMNEMAQRSKSDTRDSMAKSAFDELQSEGWNQQVFSDVKQFAIKSGITEEAFGSIVDSTQLRHLQNSMNWVNAQKGVKKKTKVKRKTGKTLPNGKAPNGQPNGKGQTSFKGKDGSYSQKAALSHFQQLVNK